MALSSPSRPNLACQRAGISHLTRLCIAEWREERESEVTGRGCAPFSGQGSAKAIHKGRTEASCKCRAAVSRQGRAEPSHQGRATVSRQAPAPKPATKAPPNPAANSRSTVASSMWLRFLDVSWMFVGTIPLSFTIASVFAGCPVGRALSVGGHWADRGTQPRGVQKSEQQGLRPDECGSALAYVS